MLIRAERELKLTAPKSFTAIARSLILGLSMILALFSVGQSQSSLPTTAAETLSGKTVVLSDAVRGHAAVIVVGFSREAGGGCGDWVKAIRSDAAMKGVEVYSAAMLEQAPGFVRGMIKSGMRKGLSPEDQHHFLVFTKDEKQWRAYFGVSEEKDPYVVFLDVDGKVLWRGYGSAGGLEAQLRAARR